MTFYFCFCAWSDNYLHYLKQHLAKDGSSDSSDLDVNCDVKPQFNFSFQKMISTFTNLYLHTAPSRSGSQQKGRRRICGGLIMLDMETGLDIENVSFRQSSRNGKKEKKVCIYKINCAKM